MTGEAFATFNRLQGVGASEVPALLGQSPWSSEVGLWMEKVGLGQPRRESEAMRIGTALEGAVLRIAADELDRKMVRNRTTFLHPDWPDVRLFGTPDGFTKGRWSVVEVKVVGHHWEDWRDGPPAYVQTQVQSQMAVIPKATRAVVVALMGTEVRTFDVERDRVMIEAIEADVRAFWETYVKPEVAPPAETAADRWAVARVINARAPEAAAVRIADDDEEVAGARLLALLEARDDVLGQIEAVRLDLAERAAVGDIASARWRGSWGSRRNTDWAALARDLGARPKDIEARTTESRVFTFRRSKATEDPAELETFR